MHLDGYNLVPYLTGQVEKSPREAFIYCNDDQQVTGLRFDNWKLVFMEQRAPGTLRIWAEPFTTLRVPKIFNLGPIPTSAPTSRRTRTTTGCSTTSTCSCRPRTMWANS